VVEHHLLPEVVAAGWDSKGRKLMLASAESKAVRIYDASPARPSREAVAASLLAAIEEHPDEESAWEALAKELQGDKDSSLEALRAAAHLGLQARFVPAEKPLPAETQPMKAWRGTALRRVVQVAQACAFRHWDEVIAMTAEDKSSSAAGWLELARATAFAETGHLKESEAATRDAWMAHRALHGEPDSMAISAPSPGGTSSVSLTAHATARPDDDWAVEDPDGTTVSNHFPAPTKFDLQPDGVQFQWGDFILVGGKEFRFTAGHMVPRSTGWIPFNAASRKVACVVGAACTLGRKGLPGTCIGSLFLLRKDGGVVRVPLVYGQNIWGWWVPNETKPGEGQRSATIWTGENERATYHKQTLALYRLDWAAKAGESPVVAISIASTMRQPAPLLMAVDAQPDVTSP
jgi:hypothetical protein